MIKIKYKVLLLFLLISHLQLNAGSTIKTYFIENKGQIVDQNGLENQSVLYLLQLGQTNVQLRQKGFSYEINKNNKAHRVDLDFLGSNSRIIVEALDKKEGRFNYYKATNSNQPIKFNHFGKIIYREVYPGIDLEFLTDESLGSEKQFKYNFIIHPGADISKIKIEVKGANSVFSDAEGNLHLLTQHGELQDKLPISYEANLKGDLVRKVKVGFINLGNSIFGIQAESYNKCNTLIVDPLLWSTYFGGHANEEILDNVTDSDSTIVICGYTTSSSGIATTGAYQTTSGGSNDGYVAKFNANGSIQWATYYGKVGAELFRALAIGLNGEIFVAGNTTSDSMATPGAAQPLRMGSSDGIIISLDRDGVIKWATYLGGANFENLNGIHCNKENGNIVVAGSTGSETIFPQFPQVNGDSLFGSTDIIIAKYSRTGGLIWLSYYGGVKNDMVEKVVTDNAENIYLVGNTASEEGITTSGSHKSVKSNTSIDALFAIFNPDGTLKYGTYYGGTGPDFLMDVCLGNNGNVAMVGYTTSENEIATIGAFKTELTSAQSDAFIVNFDTSGTIKWGSYFGADDQDYFFGVTADINGKIYCGGYSYSDTAISTTDAEVFDYVGGGDGLIAVFKSDGSLNYASYFGGVNFEVIRSLDIDVNQNMIFSGYTLSDGLIATANAYQVKRISGTEGFLGKMSFGNSVSIPCDFTAGFTVNQLIQCERGNEFVFTDTTTASGVTRLWDFGNGNSGLNQEERVSYIFGPQNYFDVRLTLSAGTCESIATQRVYLIANPDAKAITGNDVVKRLELVTYSVPFTNGSTYEWFYENGIGSSRSNTINIRWTSKGTTTLKVVETNNGPCIGDTISLAITIDAAVGEEEINPIANSMYPNPVQDKLSLIGLQIDEINYTIMNSQGSEFFTGNYSIGQTINTSSLPIGYYLLIIKNKKGERQVFPFIKTITY